MKAKFPTSPSRAALAVAVLALGALTPSTQAGCCGGPPVNTTFKGSPSKLSVVTTVDGGNMTMSNDKKYLIGDAKIIIDGKPSDLASIKPGMSVMVSCKVVAGEKDLYKASRITARSPK